MRRNLPVILAIVSLPAGLAGYFAGAWLLRTLAPSLADGVLVLFVPLLVAGLCMAPFLVPYIDRRAKADLAVIQARRAAEEADEAEGVAQGPASRPGPKRQG
ncbi:MAG TPA: hypothetical protein VES19_15495 [Candidatus Limnocylindrales bacterium]|nr:hypothetical protein [Candidatus Limnocylindrales bacterium]